MIKIIRIDKFICECMGISRTDAKKLISQGKVCVKGKIVRKNDEKIQENDVVTVNGQHLVHQKFVYIMLNKPQGVVSAREDKNDVTVVDLVKEEFPRRNLFPAGRLDKTSTGFVLITDDGEFSHNILSPKKHVSKEYIVTLDKKINDNIIEKFNSGVTLADGTVLKSAVLERTDDELVVKVILKQGVYHQIKRMFGVFDIGVNKLHRTKIGQVELDKSLKPGCYRLLTEWEIDNISKN